MDAKVFEIEVPAVRRFALLLMLVLYYTLVVLSTAAPPPSADGCSSNTWLNDLWATQQLSSPTCAHPPPTKPVNISFAIALAELAPRAHKRFAINIGANDGVEHDPTHPLFEAGFAGVAFEGAEQFKAPLAANLAKVNSSGALHIDWGYADPGTIAQHLRRAGTPDKPAALKIDIDSIDLAIMRAILTSGISPEVIMAEINHEIPPPIQWSVKSTPAFRFDLKATWAGYYGASADAFYSLLSEHGYALLAFELWGAEHNMWFVRSERLAKVGASAPTWEAMVEAFWKAHYDASLLRGPHGGRNRAAGTGRGVSPFNHLSVEAQEQQPFAPQCVHFVACPLRTIVNDTTGARAGHCGGHAHATAPWRLHSTASRVLAQPNNAALAASLAKRYDSSITHGVLPRWAGHGKPVSPCEAEGASCESEVSTTTRSCSSSSSGRRLNQAGGGGAAHARAQRGGGGGAGGGPRAGTFPCSRPVVWNAFEGCASEQFKSQHHEDTVMFPIVHHITRGKPGSFVELGALDGVHLSNTYALEKCYGWRGVLIEADPTNFAALKQSDRKAARIHAAVCDATSGTMPITRFGESGWGSGNVMDFKRERIERFGMSDGGVVNLVPCKPLQTLMRAGGHESADFMSLDVEGAELAVLMNANVSALQLIMIESDGDDPEREAQIKLYLEARGFFLAYILQLGVQKGGGVSRVYAQTAIKELPYYTGGKLKRMANEPDMCFDSSRGSPNVVSSYACQQGKCALAADANADKASGRRTEAAPPAAEILPTATPEAAAAAAIPDASSMRPGLIVSSSATKFERAQKAVAELGFDAKRSPAVFIDSSYECYNPPGSCPLKVPPSMEGHRLAMRGAWQTIVNEQRAMAVFEDDVAVKIHDRPALEKFLLHSQNVKAEIAYMGEVPHFFALHAQWITPSGAAKMLNATSRCLDTPMPEIDLPNGTGLAAVDMIVQKLCYRRDIRCVHAPGATGSERKAHLVQELTDARAARREREGRTPTVVRSNELVGIGFFGQNRSLGNLIHDKSDAPCVKLEWRASIGDYACAEHAHIQQC